ncbi:MAG: sulfite exporter TauE/SafE family protein [Aggregatilineales bacterium]
MLTDSLLIALISFLIGLSKGGLGGPVLGAMIAPLLSQVMPVQQAVGITLPMLLTGDAMALRAYWRAWDWRYLRILLPAALISTFIGVAMLRDLPNETLKRLLGLFCLLTVAYKLGSDTLKNLTYTPRNWHAWLAGFIAGLGSAVANVGAPAFTAYMLLQKVSPRIFMGTVTVFFGVLNVLKVPLFLSIGALQPDVFLSLAWMLLLVPLGVGVGYWLVKRLSPRAFELSMLVLLIYISFALLFG